MAEQDWMGLGISSAGVVIVEKFEVQVAACKSMYGVQFYRTQRKTNQLKQVVARRSLPPQDCNSFARRALRAHSFRSPIARVLGASNKRAVC